MNSFLPMELNFTLIICTYQRSKALSSLLDSVKNQTLYPNQILIIDGSLDNETEILLSKNQITNLEYYKVTEDNRGLTKQRNFGVNKVNRTSQIICFLDDDIVLTEDYFKNLISTYSAYPSAIGVGGYIKDEVKWVVSEQIARFDEYSIDGYTRKLGSRNLFRKKMKMLSDDPPGYMPEFSNGLSISFLPPSGKIYPVEFFMGGVSSYRKSLFNDMRFSDYFIGYGLYEDMDFCLRASKKGKLFVNTSAQLYHLHEEEGRPNRFKYGKMVLRNGWYVWRVKYPSPPIAAIIKWNYIAFVLTLIRLGNVVTTSQKKAAFTEAAGRFAGWFSLIFNKPKLRN